MILIGGWMVLFPKQSVGSIPASERYRDRSYIQKMSKEACRVHGVIIILAGLTLVRWLFILLSADAAAVLPPVPKKFLILFRAF